MSLTFEPLIPPGIWLMLAIAAALSLAWYGLRRPKTISPGRWFWVLGLTSLGTALLLLILLNPTWQERIPPPAGKPQLTILIDDSASMKVRDVASGRSRFEAAADLARACAQKLSGEFDVEVHRFSKNISPTSVEEIDKEVPEGQSTDLAVAISASVRTDRPSGQSILLLSDGHHNARAGGDALREAASAARAQDSPVYARTLGTSTSIDDLAISIMPAQQVAYLGQSAPILARIQRRGHAPEKMTVTLLDDEKELDRRIIETSQPETEVRFQVSQAKVGLYRYQVRLEPFAGEVTQANNDSTFLLRVVDEPIRALLVEGKPYWDSKFLVRTLSQDSSIQLSTIVRMADQRYLTRTLARMAPQNGGGDALSSDANAAAVNPESWQIVTNGADALSDAQSLAKYQVLVLGRDSDVFLNDSALENLRRWVAEESGVLVCFRGQPTAQVGERLDRILPVRWSESHDSRFRVELTDRGRNLGWLNLGETESKPVSLEQLPSLARSTSPGQLKPLTTVLATASGNDAPALSYQPYGGGRVVVIEGSGMWRWAFLPPGHADFESTYSGLWRSLLRWLVSTAGLLPGQSVALRVDQITFDQESPVAATMLVRRDAAVAEVPKVELIGGGFQEPQTFVPTPAGDGPGVYLVNFGKLPEGRYEARLAGQPKGAPTAAFDVRRTMDEELDVDARPELMARIATLTGGQVLETASPDEIGRVFKEHLGRSHPDQIRRIAAWDRWWVLGLVIAVWAAVWFVRRRSGLV